MSQILWLMEFQGTAKSDRSSLTRIIRRQLLEFVYSNCGDAYINNSRSQMLVYSLCTDLPCERITPCSAIFVKDFAKDSRYFLMS